MTPGFPPCHLRALLLGIPTCCPPQKRNSLRWACTYSLSKHPPIKRTRISIFFKYFLSLMYLQALLCPVGLKYYKRFSDHSHLIFKLHFSSFSFQCIQLVRTVFPFASSVDWPAKILECILLPLLSCMYIINVDQARRETVPECEEIPYVNTWTTLIASLHSLLLSLLPLHPNYFCFTLF